MISAPPCLLEWIPRQRWFAGGADAPRLRTIASWDVAPDVTTFLVADDAGRQPVVYQVPVARTTSPGSGNERDDERPPHVIGEADDGALLVDAVHEAVFTDALYEAVTSRRAETDDDDAPETVRADVLSGEQSNTSIVYAATTDRGPVICKLFRQVHAGLNPDIELQTALARAGSPYVPAFVGALAGSWPDAGTGEVRSGSLAFAQEFLPGVEDAWRVALRCARDGDDFETGARALGVATAAVHRSLSALFPTAPTGPDDVDTIRAAWERRLGLAVQEAPDVAALADAVRRVYERAHERPWPARQRIHGDLHLGQVIEAPHRGWIILDFEGEPLRPMSERVAPDLCARDVAGILRSIDYVAGTIALGGGSAEEWARHARRGYLEGYEGESGAPIEGPLLDALELDKAVYEAIYEARNRPAWLDIPLRAIAHLTAADR